jgi:uncharacterized protein
MVGTLQSSGSVRNVGRRMNFAGVGSFFPVLLLYLGTFAPSLVALGITAWDEGTPGVHALFGRLFQWQAAVRWYLFAIGYMAGIKLTAALVYRLIIGSGPRFGGEAWYAILVAILFSTPVQAGEEIGWRGYALPRLAARFGFARASLVLGLIWAFWHLPLFFIRELGNYGQSFPVFLLGGIALSVAMAWLYSHTNGSLLLAMLMHSAVNQTVGIVPSSVANASSPLALRASLIGWLTDAILWVSAAYFLVRMGRVEWSVSEEPSALHSDERVGSMRVTRH